MSFYDDASLVVIPSGYKTSKVYAEKPTDGSGDLAFTRTGDTATRVNSAGLIEKVRTNLVPNGLLFNSATGVLYTTITSDSPISGVSSTRITKNEASGTLRYGVQNCSASVLTGSISYTISRYFKYDGHNLTTSMEFNTGANWGGTGWVQNIDIASTGVTLQAPSGCTSKISNVGNGWYRVEVTILNGASPTGSSVAYLLKVASALSTGQGFLTAAPQLETGDIATNYIPTTTAAVSVGPVANVPRLDYLGSTCPRLLLEPQRVNLAIFSEQFDNSNWTKTNTSVTANTTVSPDGYTNADTIAFTATAGAVCQRPVGGTYESQTHTVSVYARVASGTSTFRLKCTHGGVLDYISSDFTATTTWQRFTFSATFGATIGTSLVYGLQNGTNGTAKSVIFYGFQLEANAAYATSYIPTLAASATRGADAASKTGISSLIGQSEGTIFLEFSVPVDEAVTRAISVSSSTVANRVNLSTFGGNLFARVDVGGVNQVNASAAMTGTNMNKVAFRYKSNDFAGYVNGVKVITDTSGITFPASTLDRISNIQPDSSSPFNGKIAKILLFTTGLTDAQLATLTTI
jgi:hypothetical protein